MEKRIGTRRESGGRRSITNPHAQLSTNFGTFGPTMIRPYCASGLTELAGCGMMEVYSVLAGAQKAPVVCEGYGVRAPVIT